MIPLLLLLSFPLQPVQNLEGKWYGITGTTRDKIEIGFEFRSKATGEITGYLYEPELNFYGLESSVSRQGNDFVLQDLGIALRWQEAKLIGTWSGLKIPIELHRTKDLPREKPIPRLSKGPGPAWELRLGTPIWAPVAVLDGTAYIGNTGGVFHAIDTRTGSIKWTFSAGKPIYGEALPTAQGVYFTCDDGYLRRLDPRTGKEVWRHDLNDSRIPRVLPHPTVYEYDYKAAKPSVVGDTLYVGSGANSFHAVDCATGQLRWQFETGGAVRTNAVSATGKVVFGCFDGYLYCVNASTGTLVWKRNTFAPVDTSPCVVGDNVIAGNHGSLYGCYRLSDGEPVWRSMLWGSAVESTAVLFEGKCYMGSSDLRRTMCFDPDGKMQWRTDVYGWAWGKPLVTEDSVYQTAAGAKPYQVRHEGGLTKLDRRTGKIVWRWPFPRGSDALYSGIAGGAALAGDLVLVATVNGTVFGFKR